MQEGGPCVEEAGRVLLGEAIAHVMSGFLDCAAQFEACFAPLPDSFNCVFEE